MLLFCAAQIVSDLFPYYYAILTEEMDDEGNNTAESIEDEDYSYKEFCNKLTIKVNVQRAQVKFLQELIAEDKDLLLTMRQREEIKLLREELADEKNRHVMTMQLSKGLHRENEAMVVELQKRGVVVESHKRGAPHFHTMGSH